MKALALFSGGLDSLLAIKIIKDMGVDVLALHLNIGFGAKRDKSEILRQRLDQIGVELKIVDIRKQFLMMCFLNQSLVMENTLTLALIATQICFHTL